MNAVYDTGDSMDWAAVVIRAADAAWDGSRYVGSELGPVDEAGALALGLEYRLIRDGQFCAVAAPSREAALQIHAALGLHWRPYTPVPSTVSTPSGADTTALQRQYRWRVHADPVSSATMPCRAYWQGTSLTLRANTGRDAELAAEAAAVFDIPLDGISVTGADIPPDQSSYDAAIDAAIVARMLQRPVQVWPCRESDLDTVLTIRHAANVGSDGRLLSLLTQPGQPEVLRPSAATICTLAGREAVRFQQIENERRLGADYARSQLLQAPLSTIRLDSALTMTAQRAAQLFAQESYADELAQEAGCDPVQWRLQQVQDPAGRALLEQVAAAAGWRTGIRGGNTLADGSETRRGQGFACAHVIDESRDPALSAWAAWVVDVSVDASTGSVKLDKITVGHHLDDLLIADAEDSRWGQELASAAQNLLQAGGTHDLWLTRKDGDQASSEGRLRSDLMTAGSAPITDTTARIGAPAALSSSPALGLPAAAAVANAIYDATGIRLREAPFGRDLSDEVLQLGLDGNADSSSRSGRPKSQARRAWAWALGIAGGLAGAVIAAVPWRPVMAPVTPDLSLYSAAAIERGRLVAAASDCVVCHTAAGGEKNAGGLAMDTPFGTIYSTNITSDRETGIGAWSFAAFDRAMRQGISRDGRHLYPAFPYTSFAKFSDGDMQALYAYLMSEPAVAAKPPETKLAFPFSMRPMMAYWNLLFHENEPYAYNTEQSALWNRGAYLVQGPGHCMACHSPRNAMGAEKNGPSDFLAGGVVDGWVAPALNGSAPTTVAWTAQDTFDYLRTGFSDRHGVAAGPMAPVVASLQALPDSDIQAMAVYLSSLRTDASAQSATASTPAAEPSRAIMPPEPRVLSLAGQNVYEGACAACHDATRGSPMFGVRPSLPLNTNITADEPDNLIRIVLEGIAQPADPALGYMPGFADTLNDKQIVELASYLRGKYAAQRDPWNNLEESVQRVRAESERHASHTQGGRP